MKYRFITILHNMELEKIKSRGTVIFPGFRISNGERILSETVKTDLMRGTLGVHSVDEFEETVYAYIDNELGNIHTKEQMDEIGVQYTFSHLRQIQQFTNYLWEVKDNNVYVRDGFLLAYNNNFEDGCTYKASLSEIFTYSNLEKKTSRFSDQEIENAIRNFVPSTLEELDEEGTGGGKYATADHLFAKRETSRMIRATYFTGYARRCAILPTKIFSYCNALECLFNTGAGEVNHKIAERVACMLGTTNESKRSLFDLIKKAYGYRSSLVHGQALKGTDEEYAAVSVQLDDILRKLLVEEHEIFSRKKKEEIDDFFQDLLFSSSSSS